MRGERRQCVDWNQTLPDTAGQSEHVEQAGLLAGWVGAVALLCWLHSRTGRRVLPPSDKETRLERIEPRTVLGADADIIF